MPTYQIAAIGLVIGCSPLCKPMVNNLVLFLTIIAVKVVVAIRADLLEQLGFFPDLGKIINQGNLHLVTDMHKDELQPSY